MSDAKELREAIRDCERYLDGSYFTLDTDSVAKVVAAAKEHLALLPGSKE